MLLTYDGAWKDDVQPAGEIFLPGPEGKQPYSPEHKQELRPRYTIKIYYALECAPKNKADTWVRPHKKYQIILQGIPRTL
jgi:hypothetical protein